VGRLGDPGSRWLKEPTTLWPGLLSLGLGRSRTRKAGS